MDEERNICLSCKEPCSVEVQEYQKKTFKVHTFMETLIVSECTNKEHVIQKVEKYLEGGFDSIWKVEEVK